MGFSLNVFKTFLLILFISGITSAQAQTSSAATEKFVNELTKCYAFWEISKVEFKSRGAPANTLEIFDVASKETLRIATTLKSIFEITEDLRINLVNFQKEADKGNYDILKNLYAERCMSMIENPGKALADYSR